MVMKARKITFINFKIKNLTGLPVTRSNAKGMTTKVSRNVVPIKIFKKSGFSKPKKLFNALDDAIPKIKNVTLLIINNIKAEDMTLFLLFSEV